MQAKKIIISDYVAAVCVIIIAAGLLTRSGEVSEGIKRGLEICAGVLIPALFPFMVLSSFISLTGAARILSIPLTHITTKLFKLPKELGAIVLLSLVGGYPVGAKSVSLLLSQKKIDKSTAERMLCFCVNSGPSFLITAVGTGMLFSKTAGIILFSTQTAATLIIGSIVSMRTEIPVMRGVRVEAGGAPAFVAAVSNAASAMLSICSFAILFSGILSLISASGIAYNTALLIPIKQNEVNAVIGGFFEVTAGCLGAAKLGGITAFALISAIVSFGGLSVIFQIMACFRETPISFRPFILSRIFHMFLSTLMAVFLYRHFCETQETFATVSGPVIHTDTRTWIISVSLLCMCAITTLSVRK